MTKIEKLQTTISPSSCANIQFTSGTTGKAKAARMSHFSLINNGYDMGLYICKLTSSCFSIFNFICSTKNIFFLLHEGKRLEFDKISARICVNNPLFHAYGTAISIMVALNHAGCMILPSPHFMPERSLDAIVNEKCNVIYGTPTSECLFTLIWKPSHTYVVSRI